VYLGIIFNMKYYPYEEFRKDTRNLLLELKDFSPDVIICIARGGMTLGHAVAEGLNIRDVQMVRTELYDSTEKREDISFFGECNLQSVSKAIILDDIADSGETLMFVYTALKKEFPNVDLKSATLFYKKTSVFEPDYWINEADDWIDFFWERDFLPN